MKNIINIKNTLLLSAMMSAAVLFNGCGKDTEPTPGVQKPTSPKTETLVVNSQSTAANDIRHAAEILGDATVGGVVLDMKTLNTLELGDAGLSDAINTLVSQSAKNSVKSVRIIVPRLSVKGDVKISPKFYEFTRGSNKYGATTRSDAADATEAETPATIIIQDDGSLHFSGELQSSELLSVLSAMENKQAARGDDTEQTPRITADRIKITERMGTAGDGPAYGLPLWAIFKLVKTNEIVAGVNDEGYGFDGSGNVLFGHLGDTGHAELKDAQNLMFYDFGDKELRRSSTPRHRRSDARVVFDKPINMTAEFYTDTVRMGGAWNNGVWTPDVENWLDVIAESQIAYGRPYIVLPTGYVQMTPEQRKEQYRLIIHTKGVNPGSDTIIDGVKRDWVNLEEIIAFNKTVLTGAANIKWRPGKPLAVRVPSERTPAELKAPTDEGELHSWDNYFFYDCRIDVNMLPGNVTPIVPVVDTNIKLNLTKANKVRAMTRAAAHSSINARKR